VKNVVNIGGIEASYFENLDLLNRGNVHNVVPGRCMPLRPSPWDVGPYIARTRSLLQVYHYVGTGTHVFYCWHSFLIYSGMVEGWETINTTVLPASNTELLVLVQHLLLQPLYIPKKMNSGTFATKSTTGARSGTGPGRRCRNFVLAYRRMTYGRGYGGSSTWSVKRRQRGCWKDPVASIRGPRMMRN